MKKDKSINNTIPFSVLYSMKDVVEDTNNLVWIGLNFNESEKDEIEKFFKEIELIDKDSKIEYMSKITDNINGENGRTDVHFRLSGKGVINPLKRLELDGLMWLSDFLENYKKEYYNYCD